MSKHNKTVVGVLKKAVTHIEKGWAKGAYAKDAKGEGCDPLDRRAKCWCAVGAVQRATGLSWTSTDWTLFGDVTDLLRAEADERGFTSIASLNDCAKTRRQVISLFKAAIKRAERAENKSS